MKLVNRKMLLSLPEGTVYDTYHIYMTINMCVKNKNLKNDWYFTVFDWAEEIGAIPPKEKCPQRHSRSRHKKAEMFIIYEHDEIEFFKKCLSGEKTQ